jgi:acyl-CoA reductase-like NAD-dependent aldehyde dehydrogenase
MQVNERIFVGRSWRSPTGGGLIEVVSPHSEEVIANVATPGPEDVDLAVAAARWS